MSFASRLRLLNSFQIYHIMSRHVTARNIMSCHAMSWNVKVAPRVNKLKSVLLRVCPVIDHEFRDSIVKVAADPQGDSRVDLQTTLTML